MAFNLGTNVFIHDKRFHLDENKDIVLSIFEVNKVNLSFTVTSATFTIYLATDINEPVTGFDGLSITAATTANGKSLTYKLNSATLPDGADRYVAVFRFTVTNNGYAEVFESEVIFDVLDTQTGLLPPTSAAQYAGQILNDSTVPGASVRAALNSLKILYYEVILNDLQTLTGYGITSAMALIITVNPSIGNTLHIQNGDGYDIYTFVASAAAPFEVTIEATLADTLPGLVNVINTDRTTCMAALCYNLTGIDPTIPVIALVDTGVTPGPSDSRCWTPDLTAEIVDYSQADDYSGSTRTAIPTADPLVSQFGFYRGSPAVLAFEKHAVRETGTIIVWDKENSVWYGLERVSTDPVFPKVGMLANNYEIDLTVAGTANILYSSGTHYTQVTTLVFKMIAEDTITVVPQISIGTNSPNYDNIIPATTLTGFNAANLSYTILVAGLAEQIIPAQDVILNIITPATAVIMSTDIDLIGYEWG